MKKDLVEVLNVFDKNKTIGEILTILGKEAEISQIPTIVRYEDPELVDLGLPSGNLWMKCNLGAINETDPGNYYQFGSLVGYQGVEALKHSTWSTCPFNDGNGDFNKEYFKANRSKWFNEEGLLKPEFDIITQTYGSEYKIPTDKDFKELLDNTLQRTYTGGILFISKINCNAISIPLSGHVWDGSFGYVGRWSFLWSSRLDSNYPDCAYNLYKLDYADLLNYQRTFGFPIRGIKVKGN